MPRYKAALSAARAALIAAAAAATLVLVLAPALYVVAAAVANWRRLVEVVFFNPRLGCAYWLEALSYLSLSLRVALVVAVVDLALGLPLAHLASRGPSRWRGLVEDLATLTLVLPTSGFGFATLIAWSGVVSSDATLPLIGVPVLVVLVHVALTLPYVVKTLSAALGSVERAYEVVSRSLGAAPLTTFRRVTLPLIAPSVVSALALAVTRSLGETGATMVVSGVRTTASVAIVRWVFEFKLEPAVLLSVMLAAISLGVVLLVEGVVRARRLRVALPAVERSVVRLERAVPACLRVLRDAVPLLALIALVALPLAALLRTVVEYWAADPYTGRPEGGVLYQLLGPPSYLSRVISATVTSLVVATVSTAVSTYLALLVTLTLLRTRLGGLVRALLRVPLVIPTSALGLSSLLFWRDVSGVEPSVWLTILTHIAFSVPIVVEAVASTYESVGPERLEDVARTLGASPYVVAETVTLPLIKRGVVAGAVLAFAHSLGETGATFLVMGRDVTVPVLVVNMVESLALPAAMFTSAYLTALSVLMFAVVRLTSR